MDLVQKFHLSDLKTIIVGVDFSEESKQLVEEGVSLAKICNAKLVLVHVVPVDPYIEANLALAQPWDELGDDKAKEIRSFYGLNGAQIEVRFGRADSEIELLAQKYVDPLILVGHSHKSWFERVLTGSTARSLAMKSRIPVLIY